MSHIALPIAELKPALIGLGKVVSKRCTLPVLGNIKIDRTKDGWIALTGTDLDAYVTVRLEQPSDGEPVSLLVPYDELLKITKNCTKADTILVQGGEKASEPSVTIQYAIGNQLAEAKVSSLQVEEFPPTPKIEGEAVPVSDAVRQSIHEAMDCASVDETRLILNSAYIDVSRKEGHYVIGTNGSHLFASNSFMLPLKECVVLPSHKFIDWRDFSKDGEWQLRIGARQHKDSEAWFQLSSRRWRFIGHQVDGNYPNWRQVLPGDAQFASTIQLDPQQADSLADTIEKLPEHDTINHTIGIERKERVVSLLWKSDKEADWQRLPVAVDQLKGNNITICLNRHYLIKALRFGLNRLDCIDSISPMRFSHEGRLMIVMPVRAETVQYKPASPATEATTPPPAAPSTAAQQERTTMPRNAPATTPPANTNGNGNGHQQPPAENKPALEIALEQIETIKGSYREAIQGLNGLADTLKQVQREHKSVQSFRNSLEKLQSVKI